MEPKNAIIDEVQIGFAGADQLTSWIVLNFGMAKQGFGGVDLTNNNVAAKFIMQVLKVVGVGTVNDLVGKAVRVRHDEKKIHFLGNYINDAWLSVDTLELSSMNILPVIDTVAEEVPPTVVSDSDGLNHYGVTAEPGTMGAKLS
jgi:hypothetical protein